MQQEDSLDGSQGWSSVLNVKGETSQAVHSPRCEQTADGKIRMCT